jgi:WD40 repeat protein
MSGRSIAVWDVQAATPALEFSGHDSIDYFAFSVDGTRIISGDGNGDFRTWDAVAGVAIVMIPSKSRGAGTLTVTFSSSKRYWVDISPDGKWIVTGCQFTCAANHKDAVRLYCKLGVWNSTTLKSNALTFPALPSHPTANGLLTKLTLVLHPNSLHVLFVFGLCES